MQYLSKSFQYAMKTVNNGSLQVNNSNPIISRSPFPLVDGFRHVNEGIQTGGNFIRATVPIPGINKSLGHIWTKIYNVTSSYLNDNRTGNCKLVLVGLSPTPGVFDGLNWCTSNSSTNEMFDARSPIKAMKKVPWRFSILRGSVTETYMQKWTSIVIIIIWVREKGSLFQNVH